MLRPTSQIGTSISTPPSVRITIQSFVVGKANAREENVDPSFFCFSSRYFLSQYRNK